MHGSRFSVTLKLGEIESASIVFFVHAIDYDINDTPNVPVENVPKPALLRYASFSSYLQALVQPGQRQH